MFQKNSIQSKHTVEHRRGTLTLDSIAKCVCECDDDDAQNVHEMCRARPNRPHRRPSVL